MSKKTAIRPEHHGTTTGYTYGCRQACCRAAVAERQRALYHTQREDSVARLRGSDITLSLLHALATLTDGEREAWIDWNLHHRRRYSKQQISIANGKIRAYFGTPDALRDAA